MSKFEFTEQFPDFDKLWNFNNPSETEVKFRELLLSTENNNDYKCELLTQLARAEGLQRKFDSAHSTLDKAEKLLNLSVPRLQIRLFLERGRVFNSSGRKDKAVPFFLKAWETAKSAHEDFFAVDAAHMLGIATAPDEQVEWNIIAMEYAENASEERAKGWLGALYNNLGWTYFDMKKYETALGLFEKGLEWRKERKQVQEIRIARWSIAKTKRMLGHIEEAIEIQFSLKKEYDEDSEKDGYVFEEIAECLLALSRQDEAKTYFKTAYEYLSKDEWLMENEKERMERLKQLGEES
jgi:tetratricopeptide (TPR) repeat protein